MGERDSERESSENKQKLTIFIRNMVFAMIKANTTNAAITKETKKKNKKKNYKISNSMLIDLQFSTP